MVKSYKVKDKDSKQKMKLAPNFQVRMHDQIEKSEKYITVALMLGNSFVCGNFQTCMLHIGRIAWS